MSTPARRPLLLSPARARAGLRGNALAAALIVADPLERLLQAHQEQVIASNR